MRWPLVLLGLLLGSPSFLSSQSVADPALLLGLTPQALYEELGAPSEVYPVPVDGSRWQVAHYYSNHLTVYWSSNHVWQVRLDRRYAAGFLGLTMGQPRDRAIALLGAPAASNAAGSVPAWDSWALTFRAFPRQIRLVFENGLLVDASFYRSDL